MSSGLIDQEGQRVNYGERGPMMARCRAVAVCIACSVLLFSRLEAQRLDNAPVTANFAGVGPVTLTPVAGIKAMLATPRILGGARVVCFDVSYKCDIGVQPRTMGDFARPASDWVEEMQGQFRGITPAPPSGATLLSVTTPQSVEVHFTDLRSNAQFRHTALAVVFRGSAILKVFAQGPDSATVASMVNIARTAKPDAAHEMLAMQFAQFVGVCNSRVPATQASNTRALAASPFRDAALLSMLRQRDTTMTLEKILQNRSQQLPQLLRSYDDLAPISRQTFCSDLPKTIAAAAREFRAP
ncbi:MAG: hypothetical protein H7Z40_20690 [Phycisphaerae bacterium]|nr:hypothetical protein [Gemmatimonadaceae bacterium]